MPYVVSLVIAAVMTVASIAGLLFGTTGLYGTQTNLFAAFLGQDVLNLTVGLPMLLGAMWLARRGALIGQLLWPGALFYILYDYAFYVLGGPVNVLFLAYLALVTASAYTMVALVLAIDANAARRALGAAVPARAIAGTLIVIAALFTVLWTVAIFTTALGGPTDPIGRVVYTADLTIQLPALFLGGLMLWRRRAIGYVVAPGLLLQAGVYLLGLSAICLTGSSPTGAPATVADWSPGLLVGAVTLGLLAFYVRAPLRHDIDSGAPQHREQRAW